MIIKQQILDVITGEQSSHEVEISNNFFEPSKEEQIAELKEQLTATDYKVTKCYEYGLAGLTLPYDISALHIERQAIRDQINELGG